MGLHGSSTTPLILQDVKVPAENVLGEIGKGHKVAFNVLNYGRFKLAAMCSGGARAVVGEAAKYAAERKQFGQPIASFGAIKHKLAEMVDPALRRREHALSHRRADRRRARRAATPTRPSCAALEEFAIEASILKVAGSEMIDYAVDENVQIHGGNGFVRDYPAERHYRDARVNRIFEGTNEINRLLIPGMLVRRAREGRPAAHPRGEEAAGRDPHAVDARAGVGRAARGRAPGRGGVEEGRADGARHRDADLRREAHGRAGSADARRRHHHRRLRRGERAAAGRIAA